MRVSGLVTNPYEGRDIGLHTTHTQAISPVVYRAKYEIKYRKLQVCEDNTHFTTLGLVKIFVKKTPTND